MKLRLRFILAIAILLVPSAVWAIDQVVRIDSGLVEGIPGLTP
jgi:hypothetical protein